MEYRLLGPLEVTAEGEPLKLGGRRQKLVLADLLIHRNEVVTTDRLILDVWGEQPPPGARNTLQSYVSNLRRLLGEGRIEGRPPGYMLRIDPDEVDAARFEAMAQDAHASVERDPTKAAGLLTDALVLWRGPPMTDLSDEAALRPEVTRLEELRHRAIEDRIEADLHLGEHDRLVPELEVLVDAEPVRERRWAQLMLALYRSGRQAEALQAYDRVRESLSDELGIDPSPDLQRLHAQILRQDPSIAATTRRLRGYRLIEEIGAGAYGIVYRAHQPQVDREVAVKVVHPRLADDPLFIRRFEAEAQMIAGLEHPHIVPLYDYWREPNGAYLVMRLLRGGSLRSRIDGQPMEPGSVARIMDQVSAALAAAHRQGIVHRDVKPANILLDEDRNAYLSDFGIAFEQTSARAPADALWTSGYMSPEQIRGEPPTPKADIYSLGVVLFEMLTGHHPFRAASPEELARRHLSEPMPSLASFGSPPALNEVIRVATAKDADGRFASVDTMAAAVRDQLVPVGATGIAGRPEPRNPYKGLRPFLESDAGDFFGREGLVERLLDRSSDPDLRLLAVVGPSGCGKSSVVRAGLIPALRRGRQARRNPFVVEMLPGAHPFHELADALTKVAVERSEDLVDELERDDQGVIEAVRRTIAPGSELVLVIDQFEEVFTLIQEREERERFLRALVAAVTDPRSPVRIVLTLRADFYDRPLSYRRLGELVRAGTEVVLPLSTDELERAVARPAEREGVTCESALVTEIVADVADQPGALPLLQYTLTELFERRKDGTLTLDSYRAMGGVSGSLVRRAEATYSGLDEDAREALRQVFLRLVALGEGVQDTRRRVPRSELLTLEGRTEQVGRVIDAFGGLRLLSFDRDPRTREPTVEVAHEALLGAWGRLQGWIDSAREDMRMHRRLVAATAEWERAGREPSFLVRGSRLEQLETWAATSELALARTEQEYLDASVEAREEELAAERERRRREEHHRHRSMRRLRALVAVLTVASILAGLLTVFAFDQRSRAREEAARAERQAHVAKARELASASTATYESDPDLGILLALEAFQRARSSGDERALRAPIEALHRALQQSRVVLNVPGLYGVDFTPDGERLATTSDTGAIFMYDVATAEEVMRLCCHEGLINLDLSRDGRMLATTGGDGTARVWDARTGEELHTLEGFRDRPTSPAFSPDGQLLAVTSFDSVVRVWDTSTGELVHRLTGRDVPFGLDFTPDGRFLVTSGLPTTVWDLRTGREAYVLGGLPDAYDANFSTDGSRLAVALTDGVAHVYDTTTRELVFTLSGHTGAVGSVEFSYDDSRIVTAGEDGTVAVWDAATGRRLLVLSGLGGGAQGVNFTADGTKVAAGSGSGRAMVWDITPIGSRDALTIAAHQGPLFGLDISPDGTRLATAGGDGPARIWELDSGDDVMTLGSRAPVADVSYSADGEMLITLDRAGRATLWDAESGEPRGSVGPHPEGGNQVALSPDGTRVVTTGGNLGRIWDARSGDLLHELEHASTVIGVAFSPDGARVATAANDERAKIWDGDTGELIATAAPHGDTVIQPLFSPDGAHLFSVALDGAIRVWDARTGTQRSSIRGHAGGVMGVAIDASGSMLATGGADRSVRLWDTSSGEELLRLAGHTSAVFNVDFSPDGRLLAAGAEDGTVRIFFMSGADLVNAARARLTRTLTDAECRQYLQRPEC